MWAQLIKLTLDPGQEENLSSVLDQLRETEKAGSGHVHTYAMRDQNDPNEIYTLVIFESEEKARERERDESRQRELSPLRALMGQVFTGPPEFTDLTMVADW